jgi:hypothetical protein
MEFDALVERWNQIRSIKEIEMNSKTEGTIAILAALLVLFSAMWDPRVSVVVSIVALAAFGIYKFVFRQK